MVIDVKKTRFALTLNLTKEQTTLVCKFTFLLQYSI